MWKPITKNPAWNSLTAEIKLSFEPSSENEEIFFRSIFGQNFNGVKRVYKSGNFDQTFKVNLKAEDRLVKVCSVKDFAHSHDAIHIQNQAHQANLATPRCEILEVTDPGALKLMSLEAPLKLISQKFIDHVSFDPSDSVKFANQLSKLHLFLDMHSNKKIWKKNTKNRLENLSRVREKVLNEKITLPYCKSDITSIMKAENLDFVRDDLIARPLHGDMNYYNVILTNDISRDLFIIDFEDVYHSFLPLAFELALIIERFFFIHIEDKNKALRQAQIFLDEYYALSKNKDELKGIDWANIIKSLNLRSLCVLALIQKENHKIPQTEWEKFVFLYKQAEGNLTFWQGLK